MYDALKREMISRVGQIDNHLKALQGRFKDNEKGNAEAFRMAGESDRKLQMLLNSLKEELDSKADNQAIDNMGDELFSVKSTLAAMGQKGKKKSKKRK